MSASTTEAMPTVGALVGYSVPEVQRLSGLDEQAAWESAPNAHLSSVIQSMRDGRDARRLLEDLVDDLVQMEAETAITLGRSWPRAQAAVSWVHRMRGRGQAS